MGPIKFKTWLTWAIILFFLGLLADYFFLHKLFKEKQDLLNGAVPASAVIKSSDVAEATTVTATTPTATQEQTQPAPTQQDTFLVSLKQCAPEIAAQTVATPEALIEYLRKSIGIKNEDITVENYHMIWKDGSKRRVHVVASDNTNSKVKKEVRLFKVDDEGYPDPVPLKGNETKESLLAMGQVENTEVKSSLQLKDGGNVELEMHNNSVYEFQYTHNGKVLSCRLKDCQCP
ncbi:hypothetical protein [Bdellovibrio sp. NC01]|uniref:hypothetical protein n=1 Tax=Bdellovibrio sp. NC01 TaxID=2220073 RepID=UPI00115722B3|nr:hypothetical protein [Bdellovibrio sp. NC01]QDK38528.1 hypothetical protein DOE51_13555 [Bdellovibrio sp. NC01]